MKKYTKPMVNIVELSVKESLSALPRNISEVKKIQVANVNYLATIYNQLSTKSPTVTE